MAVILIRTLLIYVFLILTMRFMGKRQLGELEISDLATTLLISEIASIPVTNVEIPLSHALLPILVLMALEVLLSGSVLKLPLLKRSLSIRPAILVRYGRPDVKVMRSVRVSTEELLSQLRQKDVTDLDEVAYAILEPNGQISVVKRSRARQPTAEELSITTPEQGMMHPVVCDGKINRRNLAMAGRDEAWLGRLLKREKIDVKDVFLLTVDDSGCTRIYPKEGRP